MTPRAMKLFIIPILRLLNLLLSSLSHPTNHTSSTKIIFRNNTYRE